MASEQWLLFGHKLAWGSVAARRVQRWHVNRSDSTELGGAVGVGGFMLNPLYLSSGVSWLNLMTLILFVIYKSSVFRGDYSNTWQRFYSTV